MSPSILPILQSNRVSPGTRQVLEERMAAASSPDSARFFSPEEFRLIDLLIRAVLPQHRPLVPIAPSIDRRLSKGDGAGWRFAVLPSDPQAYRAALRVLQSALSVLSDDPMQLGEAQVITLLKRVQGKELDTSEFALSLWFESFKFDIVRIWLAHPDTMELLHYDGFADALNQPQAPVVRGAK